MVQVQVALGAGIVAVTAWGIRSFVVPQAVYWYRSFTGQPGSAMAKQTEQSEAAKVHNRPTRNYAWGLIETICLVLTCVV